jgi:hypothetical protein
VLLFAAPIWLRTMGWEDHRLHQLSHSTESIDKGGTSLWITL